MASVNKNHNEPRGNALEKTMTGMPATAGESLGDRLGDASTVLLLARAVSDDENAACTALLTVEPPEREAVMVITFTQSPADRLDIWQRHVDELPATFGVIGVGERSRDARTPDHADVTVKTIRTPGDLTGVGVAVSELTGEWIQEAHRPVVCFHSVTVLLQYADLQQAFRFLHTLTGRLEEIDAVAHFHLDPSAHDEQTLKTLRPLFDAVVEVPVEGDDWSVTF